MTMMMPGFIPFKKQLVYLTGVLEIMAAVGLLINSTYTYTAWFLIFFFLLLLPANIYAATHRVDYQKAAFEGPGLNYLWFRIPLQVLFIAWVFFLLKKDSSSSVSLSQQTILMMINYDNKIFKPVSNTENGETSSETIFHYKQNGNIVTSEYCGGKITKGHLIGIVDDQGNIDMRYHQVNDKDELMTGVCKSSPEILSNGKIRLHESWQWTSGDFSHGQSVIEEL